MPAKILIFAFLVTLAAQANAIEKDARFPALSKTDFANTRCPIDTAAQAYYIMDVGKVTYGYVPAGSGLRMTFERHFRIKILDQTATEYGNIEIPLYHNRGMDDKIVHIIATTYNLVGSEIVVTKLSRTETISEEIDEHWSILKIPMPEVRGGSIIEMEYVMFSDFVAHIPDWKFQYQIPVIESYFEIAVPEFFVFQREIKGYNEIETNQFEQRSISGLNDWVYSFTGKSLPAFTDTDFLRSANNYRSMISFELSEIHYPDGKKEIFTKDWVSVGEQLKNEERFGGQLKSGKYLESSVSHLQSSGLTGKMMLAEAYDYVRDYMTWNNKARLFSSGNVSKAWANKTGNSSDINISLINLLRELGFHTDPVILCTQDHGIVSSVWPTIDQFNYAIAMVVLDTDTILLDATSKAADFNLLPVRCLNEYGLVVNDSMNQWVDLLCGKRLVVQSNYEINILSDLSVSGTWIDKYMEHGQYYIRTSLGEDMNTDEHRKYLEALYDGLKITDLKIEHADEHGEMIVKETTFNLNNVIEQAGNLQTMNLLFSFGKRTNPMTSEKRSCPVEYDYPQRIVKTYEVSIPDGYTVEQLPQKLSIQTQDQSVRYSLNAVQKENIIIVNTIFTQTKIIFLPEDYLALKEFYDHIITKESEKIVIRKL